MSGPAWLGTCPVPVDGGGERVTLAHGEGGRASRRLIAEHVLPVLGNGELRALGDAAVLGDLAGRPVVTTDSYVVSPLFFPGGDVGRLAVFGTANDLSVAGARPRWLTLSLLIEEGLPLAVLDLVLASAAGAAKEAGVAVVAGDTKVVPRGAADGLYVNTTGVGELVEPAASGPGTLQDGDALIVTGPIGRHGVAVLAAREALGFEPPPESDCAGLYPAMEAMRAAGVSLRCARDATRGGVGAVLHEWAEECRSTLLLEEPRMPTLETTRGVCELLGLDPLHVANEGTMVVAVPAEQAEASVAALRSTEVARAACVVGEVVGREAAPVVVRRSLGRTVPLDLPHGAPTPRIC